MPDVAFTNLLIVAAVAAVVPLALGWAPRLRILWRTTRTNRSA